MASVKARDEVVNLIVQMQDVTERVSLENELRDRIADLEQFSYIASHDLQEPLRKVSSFCTLLSDRYGPELDQDGRDFIQFAKDGALRMQSLLEDLLVYNRLSKEVDDCEVDLYEVCGAAIAMLSDLISDTNAIVTVLDMPTVKCDKSRMTILFQNLISNAIKFCDKTPVITISCKTLKNNFEISVEDNGIGIPENYRDKVFQPFRRLHANSKYKGTGMGLAICAKIVNQHHGRLWVDGNPSGGSTFKLTLKR